MLLPSNAAQPRPRDDSSPASSWRPFSSPATPGPIYHFLQDPSNSLTPSWKAGDGDWGADRYGGSSSPGDVGSVPMLREGERLAGGCRLPAPHSQVSLHITITLRGEGIGHKQTGPEAGEAEKASLPPPPRSFPQRSLPGPKFRLFPGCKKKGRQGRGGEEGVCQLKQSLGGGGGVPWLAIPLLEYVISSPAPSFPLRRNWEISLQNPEISPRRKRERVDPRLSQHDRPLPQQTPLFCEKNGKLGQAEEMSLQMESWFLQAAHPRGKYVVLLSAERDQQTQIGPSDLPQQDLAPVKYCT